MRIQTIFSYVFPVIIILFIINFIIVYNTESTGGDCNLLCGGVGAVYKDGEECLCDCPEGYDGENCEFVKPGYFRDVDGKITRAGKCENRHRKYMIAPSTEYSDTICGKCPDGYYVDGDDCKKCIDCDSQQGKYFTRKCLNNADAQCGNQDCADGHYFDGSNCVKHSTCTKYYKSKGTQSYDAKCTDNCSSDEYS